MRRAGEVDVEVTVERIAVEGDPGYIAPDSTYGTPKVVWVALSYLPGSPLVEERFPATVQDDLPGRSEGVTQGTVISADRCTLRMRYRNDITSAMRVTVHRDTSVVYQIISGPAEIEGRKQRIEMKLERYSS